MKILLIKIVLIFLSIIFSLTFAHKINAEIKPSSIAGVWLFDDGQGDTVWDSSANRNHGKFSDSKGIKWVDGKFGKALEFKGTDYVIVKHSDSLDQNDTISIALWIKVNTVGNYPSFVYKGTVGKPGYWGLHQIPGTQITYVRIDTTGGINQTSGRIDNTLDGNWHHIVFVLDKGKIKMFRDGIGLPEINYVHGDGFGCKDDLGIGSGFYPQDPRELDAIIDELGIFSVALTDDDVKNIMNNGYKKALGVSIAIEVDGKLATTWASLKLKT